MPRQQRPTSLRIRTYQVGFGDSFLLTFGYPRGKKRHVLVDLGSSKKAKLSLKEIAEKIKDDCDGRLHGLVATHRHSDHIAGFATARSRKGAGDIIASCKPGVIVQPWTEHPRVARKGTAPPRRFGSGARAFGRSLSALQDVGQAIADANLSAFPKSFAERINFIGQTNIKNASAVRNLIRMGEKTRAAFVHHGSRSGLERTLPGVEIRVLGPPTLRQSDAIRKQRGRDEDEFWHLYGAAAGGLHTRSKRQTPRRVFPSASHWSGDPVWARWLIDRIKQLSAESLLQIVRTLDSQLNNTSIILLLRVGETRLLFSGDAQIENWSYALGQRGASQLLKGVDVYKVGHHGSLNATPRSLWNLFQNRGGSRKRGRLHTICSTLEGKHGHPEDDTEVPREKLVKELKRKSHYLATNELRRSKTHVDLEVDVPSGLISRPDA